MAIENPPAAAAVAAPVIDENALKAETERLIQKAAQNHGVSADIIREQVKEEAVAQARKNLEQAAADNNSWKLLYEQEREARRIAENTLTGIREQGQKHNASPGVNPNVAVTQAIARAGEFEWNHRMSTNQKLAAVGISPESVNLKEAAKVFGRGADQKLGIDLHKADPQRYRVLKLAAMATGAYGA